VLREADSSRLDSALTVRRPLTLPPSRARQTPQPCSFGQDSARLRRYDPGFLKAAAAASTMLGSVVAASFVLLWSTGFIVARAITPFADPNLFLVARFGGTALLLALVAFAVRANWPARGEVGKHLLAGALLQGIYLGLGYWAVSQGLSAGVMALLGALQPLLTAVVAAPLFGERLPARGWFGLSLGLAGVVCVLSPRLVPGAFASANGAVIALALLSVCSITAGTLFQKTSLARTDIWTASAIQNAGAAVVAAGLAAAFQEHRFELSAVLLASLAWAVLMLSGVAATLLVWMIRHANAARVTALLFLAPPLAALQGWLLFGETLTALQAAGFALALAGVGLARR
jgi:drug/metabolite transporter (DMT)-like permease